MENFTYLTKDSQSGTYLLTVTYFLFFFHISRHVFCNKKRKKEEVLLSPPHKISSKPTTPP